MLNKSLILLSTGVMLMASSCSNDLTDSDLNPGNISDGNAKYITVAISGLPETGGTRADDETKDGYEDGTETENKVKKVRFYFFDDNGAAANVKMCSDGSFINYFDWSEDDMDKNLGGEAPNIEKTIKATLVINTKAGDHLPTRIAAIVNPTNQLGDDTRDLASLRGVISDYKSTLKDYGFTMSTSVYLGMNGTEVRDAAIPESSIQDTPQGAMLQPVVVYVERVVSKVRVKVDNNPEGKLADRITEINENTAIALVDAEGNSIKANGKQVYAMFTNWNLTGTTSKSWLNKHINPAWENIDGFKWTWNHPAFFRSYWAWNCPGAGRNYFSFNQLIGESGQKFGTASTSLYCSENAASNINFDNGAGDQYPTCGILCAVLCYENGDPVEFYKFLGETLVGEENLLNSMLSSIRSRKQLYSCEIVDGKKVFTEISAEDIELETAAAAGKATLDNSTQGRYHSYLTLSKTGSRKRWFASNKEDQNINEDFLNQSDVIKYIQEITGSVSIWKNGMTYYYFPIEHRGKIGEDGKNYGKYGIVRNHIYDMNITELYGLGTPVYNPDETIYPEKPSDNDSYIAAQIKILSWRLINNDVKLEWPN